MTTEWITGRSTTSSWRERITHAATVAESLLIAEVRE
jgi:hypothetical protein